MSADLAPRLQRSLGDAFTLERELGGGGMASVFLATDRALDRRVVVKVLDLEGAVDASAERFRREVKLIAQLQHPHVVPVLTAGGDDTLLWYVMPYVAGESLRARLVREGALPLADALRIAREMLDALAFAHERGIMHRDIKPENILLEGRHAVVADFGVAKALSDAGVSGAGLTSIGLALGTPAYMAPEQAMADATTNHRADLYAAGAVLYEMLAGAPPYAGNAQSVIAAHLTAPVPRIEDRRSDVPPAVAAVIARLMSKNPAERPQGAHEVAALLESVSTPGGTAVMTGVGGGAPVYATPGAASRRPRRAPMFAAAALVVTAAGLLWWRPSAGAAPMVAGADVIAVMPLGGTGDTATSRLGRDLAVTMSANLDGVGSLRAVDAMSVLQRAQRLPQPVPLEEARRLAAELGARSVLHGSLVREGAQVRATVALHPVEGGEVLARFFVLGSPDSLRALTDSISAKLLREVWRRGTPPSPMLSEVTTANGEALRAFLDGEREFRQGNTLGAIAAYRRAVAADSLFVQAWLRIDYTLSLALLPPDTLVRRQLEAQVGRLPARDRELFEVRLATWMPTAERIDSARMLAARYPDYHTAQYQASDFIVHSGPAIGVSLREAIPYLDRLEVLAPTHADNALHRLMVYQELGDTAELRKAAQDLLDRSTGEQRSFGRSTLRSLDAHGRGQRQPMDSVLADTREFIASLAVNPDYGWMTFGFDVSDGTSAETAELHAVIRRTGMMAANEAQLAYAEGALDVRRGNARRGVERLSALELRANAPDAVRLSGVRSAAASAWFGALPVAEAQAALMRARGRLTDLSELGMLEMIWAEGVIAVASTDSVSYARSYAQLADTSLFPPNVARQLRGLWRERRTGAVDSLIAAEDEGMTLAGRWFPGLPLTRAAIGRALVRSGDAARAEHYLQWTDALVTGMQSNSVFSTIGSYNDYERGLAREAAGDLAGAVLHLGRFVNAVDQPAPELREQVEDAKARLKRLTAQDR